MRVAKKTKALKDTAPMTAAEAAARLGGKPSKHRGKNRDKPIQVYMTDAALEALEAGCIRTGLSRPDYLIDLLLAEDKRQSAKG